MTAPLSLRTPTFRTQVRCGSCPIRPRAVCASCGTEDLLQLEAIKYYRTVKAGEPIAWAGQATDFVGSVVKGMATVSQTSPDGRIAMVGLLLPSDFIGRPGRASTPYDVTAASEVMLCCFRRQPFEQLLADTPALSDRLLAMSFDELDAAREWMMILGRRNAREKVASLLGIVARRQVETSKAPVRQNLTLDVPLTRATMADYLGLTLHTVSRVMNDFRMDGLVEFLGRQQVLVPDLNRLMAETGDDADGGLVS